MAQHRSTCLRSLRTIDAWNPMKLLVNRLSLVLIILLSASSAFAVRVERLIDTWKPEHYLVNITLNDQLSEITSASARINIFVLKPTTLIDLDFGELTIDTVTL